MPKLLDHAERERQISEASLRVLAREGLAGLSVRGVAEEAGIATASLRRAFPTQDALREHCLAVIRDRAGARMAAHRGAGRALAAAVLAELLPLDDDRRVELLAQLQLGVLALTDPRLAAASTVLLGEVRRACRAVAEELDRGGLLRGPIDTEAAAGLLHAGIDGLALHALLDPGASAGAVARTGLERLLDAVCVPDAG